MASSLFLLLDDIATVLDDVSVMTKVAAKKAAGVLGDDLALNAEQVTGVSAARELPVIWAVAKGSAINKLILVPAALAISAFIPWAVTPLLMLGGGYLCFEGAEKVLHKLFHAEEVAEHKAKLKEALKKSKEELKAVEKDKIKGAIRTDFILSAEIIVIALGTVADKGVAVQLGVLTAIAALMLVGVYGLVAGIVKLDDAGLALIRKDSRVLRGLGNGILAFAPKLMTFLSIAGTIAMFLVGGGIVAHGIPQLHHLEQSLIDGLAQPWETLSSMGFGGAVGLILGLVLVAVIEGGRKVFGKKEAGTSQA